MRTLGYQRPKAEHPSFADCIFIIHRSWLPLDYLSTDFRYLLANIKRLFGCLEASMMNFLDSLECGRFSPLFGDVSTLVGFGWVQRLLKPLQEFKNVVPTIESYCHVRHI